jgi:hypothetical protein
MIRHADGTVTHEGRVVGLGRFRHFPGTGMGDNTEYAVVLNPDGTYGEVTLSVYHDGLYDRYAEATVDAPAEAVAAYNSKIEAERKSSKEAAELKALIEEAARLEKGKRVRVVRGRKVPHGTEGEVFWVGYTRYGRRVGFTGTDGQTYWTAASNVEVIPVCPLCAE